MNTTLTHISLVTTGNIQPGEIDGADHLFYQADRSVDLWRDGKELNEHGKPVIFSLRSSAEGGNYSGSLEDRRRILTRAAFQFAYVELECERDLVPEILDVVPVEKRIISWHGPVSSYSFLQSKLEECRMIPAAYYLIVPSGLKAGEELAAVRLLKESNTQDLICYTSGSIGRWTQIMAPFLGSPMVFASQVAQSSTAPTLAQWTLDYGIPLVRSVEKIFGITGNPVTTSLSPRLHNQAYRLAEKPFLYLPFHVESFTDFWKMITGDEWMTAVGFEVGGLTTVSPFKEAAFAAIGRTVNPLVDVSGACNLAINGSDGWWADSTDGNGVEMILSQLPFSLVGKSAAVIGCGGAGRAIAVKLREKDASVTLFNRSLQRGLAASKRLNIPFQSLDDFDPGNFDIIVHATPQGKKAGELAFDPDLAPRRALIIDLTYSKGLTPLIAKAKQRGQSIGSGKEVLVHQVRQQYLKMTGEPMPLEMAMDSAGISKMKTIR